MHAVRSAARPKLSLAVPSATKPSVPQLVIPSMSCAARPSAASTISPLTPTARNTLFNQRGAASLHVPSAFDRGTPVKKPAKKRVTFSDAPTVEVFTPLPRECFGDYVKMTSEERRWSRS